MICFRSIQKHLSFAHLLSLLTFSHQRSSVSQEECRAELYTLTYHWLGWQSWKERFISSFPCHVRQKESLQLGMLRLEESFPVTQNINHFPFTILPFLLSLMLSYHLLLSLWRKWVHILSYQHITHTHTSNITSRHVNRKCWNEI